MNPGLLTAIAVVFWLIGFFSIRLFQKDTLSLDTSAILTALVLSLLSSVAGVFAGLATYICLGLVLVDRGFEEEYPVIWAYVLVAVAVLFFSAIATLLSLYGKSKPSHTAQANG